MELTVKANLGEKFPSDDVLGNTVAQTYCRAVSVICSWQRVPHSAPLPGGRTCSTPLFEDAFVCWLMMRMCQFERLMRSGATVPIERRRINKASGPEWHHFVGVMIFFVLVEGR